MGYSISLHQNRFASCSSFPATPSVSTLDQTNSPEELPVMSPLEVLRVFALAIARLSRISTRKAYPSWSNPWGEDMGNA